MTDSSYAIFDKTTSKIWHKARQKWKHKQEYSLDLDLFIKGEWKFLINELSLWFLVCSHVIRRPCWCTKQKENVARASHNNRAMFPKDFFAIVQYTNMAANDVRCKPRIHTDIHEKNFSILIG